MEYHTSLRGGSNTSTPAADVPYYAYDSEDNATYTWTSDMADFFNSNILPNYNRDSWGGRRAVAGEHKMGQVIWRLLIWKIQRKQLLILKKR